MFMTPDNFKKLQEKEIFVKHLFGMERNEKPPLERDHC